MNINELMKRQVKEIDAPDCNLDDSDQITLKICLGIPLGQELTERDLNMQVGHYLSKQALLSDVCLNYEKRKKNFVFYKVFEEKLYERIKYYYRNGFEQKEANGLEYLP